MADSRRVERVAAVIRREVSEMLVHGIRDLRVQQGMVSVTRVDVARDLQHCRILVSVFGSPDERETTLDGLKAATPYVKGELGRRLKLRRTPEVVFSLDRGLEQGSQVLDLLQRLEQDRRESSNDDAQADADALDLPGADSDEPASTSALNPQPSPHHQPNQVLGPDGEPA